MELQGFFLIKSIVILPEKATYSADAIFQAVAEKFVLIRNSVTLPENATDPAAGNLPGRSPKGFSNLFV